MNCNLFRRRLRSPETFVRDTRIYFTIKERQFSTCSILQKLGAVPKMSGVSNPILQEKLTRFRENAVLPKHLAKNQQVLIFKKKHAKMLENENIVANISGEEFRLKYINIRKDIPRLKLFINDILPLMKEKDDWDVLPNVLQGLKSAGVKMELPIAEKIVRTAGLNGHQNMIFECLKRTEDTGLKLNNPYLSKTVLFWLLYKAYEQDKTTACIKKSFSMAEQILEMLEDIKYTGENFRDVGTHQRNHPETIGIPLGIAALLVSKSKTGRDKDGYVARYAAQFVKKSQVMSPPSTVDGMKKAQEVQKLNILIKKHQESQELEEVARTNKIRNDKREKLKLLMTQWLEYIFLNTAVIKSIKMALTLLHSSFEHKESLEKRLSGLEKSVGEVKTVWRAVRVAQGKHPETFLLSKVMHLGSSSDGA